eukprot:15094091-Alexandrium_andersonii.AAC.1
MQARRMRASKIKLTAPTRRFARRHTSRNGRARAAKKHTWAGGLGKQHVGLVAGAFASAHNHTSGTH